METTVTFSDIRPSDVKHLVLMAQVFSCEMDKHRWEEYLAMLTYAFECVSAFSDLPDYYDNWLETVHALLIHTPEDPIDLANEQVKSHA